MVETGRKSDLLELFSSLSFQDSSPKKSQQNYHPQPWCGKHVNEEVSSPKNVYNYAANVVSEKTPMCQIAELARHHKLKHEYVLLDESGPAHKKKFSVKLVLKVGEEYEGSGPSIKKAQQSAAENALENSKLEKPPKRNHKNKNDNNPVWLLFNVANQLGIDVKFDHTQVYPKNTGGVTNYAPNTFNKQLPYFNGPPGMNGWNSMMNPPPSNVAYPPVGVYPRMFWRSPMFMPPSQPMVNNTAPQRNGKAKNEVYHRCSFILSDGTFHKGAGKTLGFAKTEAATKALFHLRPLLAEQEAKLRKEDGDGIDEERRKTDSSSGESDNELNNNNDNKENNLVLRKKKKKKSVVSEIHEAAFRLKMNVELELLTQAGEPHSRTYTMRCRLTSPKNSQVLEAEGIGTSKKSAKQNACKNLLEKIATLENDPVYLASLIVKSAVNKKGVNKESKRKTIVKDMKMDPQYGHHINPISRLIQVTQARKEQDPVFKLIGEHGQNRYREFVVEVKCMDQVQTGMGQNKKLAKRAAAEAMLSAIGYVKPMPQPGKSLLKKKSCDDIKPVMNEIGVFDASELGNQSPVDIAGKEKLASPVMETFEDVETSLTKGPPTDVGDDFPVIHRVRADSEKLPSEMAPIPSERRRVTFSTKVAECPPPEDSNYPASSVTLLKSEVVVAPKLKKRGRDSKKALSSAEKASVAAICRLFLSYPQAENTRSGFVQADNPIFNISVPVNKDKSHLLVKSSFIDINLFATPLSPLPIVSSDTITFPSQPPVIPICDNYETNGFVVKDAKWLLEVLAKIFKFTVSYSDFPKATDSENFFSIVTVGLDKPILLPGTGPDEDGAHLDAAYHGIEALGQLDKGN
uniref:DRBM domain-containing protein n=2 Tax=Bursaphelenchus xylophilus TaxID=6326 RepID=A0A1I7SMG8_BURXY